MKRTPEIDFNPEIDRGVKKHEEQDALTSDISPSERVYKPALPPELLERCRELRREATDAENLLWKLLRNRQLGGFKFRRHHPFDGYILDFYCHEAKLAIELDGGRHLNPEQMEKDKERTAYLAEKKLRVIRFWNRQVLEETKEVLEEIWSALTRAAHWRPQPAHLHRGRGLPITGKTPGG